MASISVPAAIAIGAGVSGAGALASGMLSSNAATDAASTQAAAANNASQQAWDQYSTTRNDLMPYNQAGQSALSTLGNQLSYLTSPTDLSTANLQNLPGYSFTLDQGLKSTQNAAAARGLGVSGAALKGAADYATGLANSNWQSYFNADQTNKQNAYNRLMGVSQLGQNAAAQTGQLGANLTQTATNAQMSGANASAAGTIGSANALSSSLSSLSSMPMQYLMMNKLLGPTATPAAQPLPPIY